MRDASPCWRWDVHPLETVIPALEAEPGVTEPEVSQVPLRPGVMRPGSRGLPYDQLRATQGGLGRPGQARTRTQDPGQPSPTCVQTEAGCPHNTRPCVPPPQSVSLQTKGSPEGA